MTRDDSLTIVNLIVDSWPGPVWETERIDAYARAIEPLDAEITTLAVARAVREIKFRPSVAELREFVRIERALSEPDEARYVRPEKPLLPEWVQRWARARGVGDMRLFPEQMTGLDKIARQSPEDYRAYAPPEVPVMDDTVWIQPWEYLEGDVPSISGLT